ncbi:hypothetical protein TNCV_613421 [Trichonephila clavipes]|nr:hypothetical protein TNCV_613421 [Trichonephila clavipes]
MIASLSKGWRDADKKQLDMWWHSLKPQTLVKVILSWPLDSSSFSQQVAGLLISQLKVSKQFLNFLSLRVAKLGDEPLRECDICHCSEGLTHVRHVGVVSHPGSQPKQNT